MTCSTNTTILSFCTESERKRDPIAYYSCQHLTAFLVNFFNWRQESKTKTKKIVKFSKKKKQIQLILIAKKCLNPLRNKTHVVHDANLNFHHHHLDNISPTYIFVSTRFLYVRAFANRNPIMWMKKKRRKKNVESFDIIVLNWSIWCTRWCSGCLISNGSPSIDPRARARAYYCVCANYSFYLSQSDAPIHLKLFGPLKYTTKPHYE